MAHSRAVAVNSRKGATGRSRHALHPIVGWSEAFRRRLLPFEENTLKRHAWALLATTLILAAPLAQAVGDKPQRLPSDKFAALDTNHDGGISREEAAAAPELSAHFDEIDVDHDGRVMPAELKAYAKTHRGSKEGGKSKATFEQLDANHDGVLTREEAAADHKMLKRFDVADTDHDGRVTMEEARAFKGTGK